MSESSIGSPVECKAWIRHWPQSALRRLLSRSLLTVSLTVYNVILLSSCRLPTVCGESAGQLLQVDNHGPGFHTPMLWSEINFTASIMELIRNFGCLSRGLALSPRCVSSIGSESDQAFTNGKCHVAKKWTGTWSCPAEDYPSPSFGMISCLRIERRFAVLQIQIFRSKSTANPDYLDTLCMILDWSNQHIIDAKLHPLSSLTPKLRTKSENMYEVKPLFFFFFFWLL